MYTQAGTEILCSKRCIRQKWQYIRQLVNSYAAILVKYFCVFVR